MSILHIPHTASIPVEFNQALITAQINHTATWVREFERLAVCCEDRAKRMNYNVRTKREKHKIAHSDIKTAASFRKMKSEWQAFNVALTKILPCVRA